MRTPEGCHRQNRQIRNLSVLSGAVPASGESRAATPLHLDAERVPPRVPDCHCGRCGAREEGGPGRTRRSGRSRIAGCTAPEALADEGPPGPPAGHAHVREAGGRLTELTPEKGRGACPYRSAAEPQAFTKTWLLITMPCVPDTTPREATDADQGEAAGAAGLPRRGAGLPRPGERQAPGAGGREPGTEADGHSRARGGGGS